MKNILCVLFLGVILSGCKFEFSTPAKTIQEVLNLNVKYLNEEDIEVAMQYVHPQSPFYEEMFTLMENIAEAYDLRAEIIDYKYIGSYGDYAFVFVKQKTIKEAGDKFKDNIVSMFSLMRKSDEQWKLWQSITVNVEYLN